ncbi:MAG: helix-turn-helix domain-containing protein [Prevotellaceae bacterium]|jgi:transcriptional regulator with XRE-family HTH domain|nr:helix-turn-helix domain-containing protein [Prevotellaceae bacterium]
MDIVENIIKIRKEKGVSQEVIAFALNVDTSVVSNIENRKRELRASELEKIAKALGIDVLYLLTYPQIYVPKEPQNTQEQPETILQIKLTGEKRKKILSDIFGKKNYEFLME